MNYLLIVFFSIFSIFSLAASKEELEAQMRQLMTSYTQLSRQGNLNHQDVNNFYLQYQQYLDGIAATSLEKQLDAFKRALTALLNRVNTGSSEQEFQAYLQRYREHRLELDGNRSVARQPSIFLSSHQSMRRPLPSALPVRSIFDEPVSANQMWDRISMDLTETSAKETKLALRTVLQFLADTEARSNIAAGDGLDLSIAGQNLYKWLRGFWTRRLTKTADSDAKDALELRIFAVRWHALIRLARARHLFELVEQLDSLKRLIEESPLVQSKMMAANRIGSMAPSEARFEPNESYPNSRAQSVLSQFSQVTMGSVRNHRAMSPQREIIDELAQITQARRASGLTRVVVQDVRSNGDCGFLALGTTRAAFVAEMHRNIANYLDIFDNFPVEQADWLAAIETNLHVGDVELALLARFLDRRIVVFHIVENEFVEQHAYGTGTEIWIAHVGIPGQNLTHFMRLNPEQTPEARFDVAPNQVNAEAVIAALNASGETINKTLRDKLLAAGFKVTGSKGKYVITHIEQTSRKNGRDDRDPPPPPGGAAGGTSGGDTAETEQPVSKKSRKEAATKPAPKASHKGHTRNVLDWMPMTAKVLVSGAVIAMKSKILWTSN